MKLVLRPPTTKALVVLFHTSLRRAYDLPPNLGFINWARDCVDMKQRVMSPLAEHGLPADEAEKFIRWFFDEHLPSQRTPPRTIPTVGWLPRVLLEYFFQKHSKRKHVHSPDAADFRPDVYKSDQEFFGLAHKHGSEHKFTKREYWIGFWWRRRNLESDELEGYRQRQWDALRRRFDEIEAGLHFYRFRQWEREYRHLRGRSGRHTWAAKMRRMFLDVQARRRDWSVERVREHYGLKQ